MQLTGSEIVIECLKEQGVDTVFGYPGGAILNIYDELYRHQDEIRHILTSHEQGAAHAADGYARSTGKVGVCMATSGPGATNLVTGIATAYMDSVPMVAITANVGLPLLGKDSFQEIDIAGVTTPITKYSFIVKDVKDLAPTLRRAFRVAQTGRPGPVLVDIVKNATSDQAEYERMVPEPVLPQTDKIKQKDIDAALKLLEKARKPIVFVGGGAVISGASEELKEFVDKLHAPVTDTLMGKGAYSGLENNYIGMLGMHGTKTANLSLSESDVLVVVGSRFSDRVTGNTATFAKNAKIIQIDVDEAEINKNISVDVSVIGDIREVLKCFNRKLTQQYHKEWMDKVLARKDALPLDYNHEGLTGPYIIEKLAELTDNEAIVATEVGQHQMWAAQYYSYKHPRSLITSGGLGTMGYGLGAAIGAKVGNPDKTVVNIAGDGCFRMNMNEIATAVRSKVPVIELVFNNHVLGMVRQWQTLFYGRRYSHTVLNDGVDFVKLAEAMGAKACRITKKEEVEPALREAIRLNEPVLIDCIIDSDDKVFPMVAPGKNLDDAFDEKDLEKQEQK
ncbi:MAG: biosynthetic-type acetolactate synthase large subunit [Clostridiaceae bacterium]|nr:biosynthetic-type acetolactate synthase large subunit [Clostridiaceae bacterium]